MPNSKNFIKEIFHTIYSKKILIFSVSAFLAILVAIFVYNIETKINTFSKIFPLSFSKSTSSPLDAIKAQFGIADKTDLSVIYNIKELVNSKTLSTKIANTSPSNNPKYKTLALWLIDDVNKHCAFYQSKIILTPKDSNKVQYIGAGLVRKSTEILVEETEFTKVITTTFNKDLSKELNLAILAEISEYYVQLATEKPRTDLNKIKIMRDSLKIELGAIEAAIAGFQDANQMSVKYSTGIPQSKLVRQRLEIEQLYSITATAYQNARFKLLSESPIFQILDYPGEPYDYKKPSMVKFSVLSFIAFIFMMVAFVCRNIFVRIVKNEFA